MKVKRAYLGNKRCLVDWDSKEQAIKYNFDSVFCIFPGSGGWFSVRNTELKILDPVAETDLNSWGCYESLWNDPVVSWVYTGERKRRLLKNEKINC